jgi:RNA polymerase sigma-70 factor, ECF subfamily
MSFSTNTPAGGVALEGDGGPRRLHRGSTSRSADRSELVRLVEAARGGDREAYGQLVERYRSVVMASIYASVRRREVAEDLAQECFIKAYSALGELREPARFAGWLRTIAAHTAADWLRARRSEVNLDKLTEVGAEPCAPQVQPGEGLEEAEEEDAILGALAQLREDYREIVVLKHLEGYSYRQIAEMLGMSVTAVGEKLSRVRTLLKKKLQGRIQL